MRQPNSKGCRQVNFRHVLLLLGLMLMFSMVGCSSIPSSEPYLSKDRDSRWVNDITYLEKTLPQVHKNLYFHLTEQEFHRQLEELKNKVPDYSDEQIEIELSVILPIRYSTKYFHWSDQDINTLEPDKVIMETFAAYREGTDPVLEWIVKQNSN